MTDVIALFCSTDDFWTDFENRMTTSEGQVKGMKTKLMSFLDRLLLRKRGVIESIIDQLKNISQIEHSRYRSPVNFVVNLLSGLIAYTLQPKKTKNHAHTSRRGVFITRTCCGLGLAYYESVRIFACRFAPSKPRKRATSCASGQKYRLSDTLKGDLKSNSRNKSDLRI